MRHELKVWHQYFGALKNGTKTFELRDNDRGFKVGDTLLLRGWDPETSEYTGDWLVRYVSYVLEGPCFGLPEGKCILSLQLV